MTEEEKVDRVVKALENPSYQWRTARGIATEAELPVNDVLAILEKNSDQVARSSIPAKSGENLYTTRRRFRETASSTSKLLGAFKNRLT